MSDKTNEVIGVDFYNLTLTGGVCMTVRAKTGDNEHTPCVMIKKEEPIAFTTEMTPKVDGGGIAFSLRSRDYKDAQCIAVQVNGRTEDNRVGIEPHGRES